MNLLYDALPGPLVEALGWTLLHFVWQGTLIAVVAAIILACLRRRSANARYLVACIALLVMALLPTGTFLLLNPTPTPQPTPTDIATLAPHTIPILSEPEAPPRAVETPLAPPPKPIVVRVIHSPTEAAPISPHPPADTPWHRDWTTQVAGWMPWIVLAWFVGVVALAIRLLAGWIQVQRLRSRQVSPASSTYQAVLAALAERLRITRPVRLLESTWAQVPMAIGWLRPVILLPACAITGLTPEQLRVMIAHELAHIRRYDYLVNLIQTVVETLLFYHPCRLVGVALYPCRARALLRRSCRHRLWQSSGVCPCLGPHARIVRRWVPIGPRRHRVLDQRAHPPTARRLGAPTPPIRRMAAGDARPARRHRRGHERLPISRNTTGIVEGEVCPNQEL